MTVLAKRREIYQQGKFANGSLLFCCSADAQDTGRQQKMGVKHCQIRKARQSELGTASRMSYFSTASRMCFVANLLACLHDLRRRNCHHHPLVLYTEDRHILPMKLFPYR